jgi:hypothetical protein
MADVVTRSSQGWLSRIMESIKGVLAGLVLVVAAFPVLFTNEGCAVRIAKGLAEGKSQVVSVSSEAVDAKNEGKLIHMTGNATTKQGVKDDKFGVEEPTAIRLERMVEMYQWVEKVETKKEKKVGGSEETTKSYTYVKEWAQRPISTANFQIKEKDGERIANPPMPFQNNAFVAKDVTVGAFAANEGLINQLTGSAPVKLTDAHLQKLPADLKGRAKLAGEGIYVGRDPGSPRVGDLRIKFTKTDPTQVSVVARQSGKSLVPFVTTQDTTLNMLQKGAVDAPTMFKNAEDANVMRTWIVRLLGFLMMMIGFSMIFKPLSVVADVVPFIGNLVGMGTGLVAFALAAPLSFITIAVAWIVYRPVLGVLLLIVGIGIFVGLFLLAKKKKAAA